MAATSGPYGMTPVGLLGGRVYAGAFRQYSIASAYGTSIFAGDLVTLVAAGTVEIEAGTTGLTNILGVFMGCSYTDATAGFIQRQYWPASTVSTDAMAYICDDPDALFKIQADATLDRGAIGINADLVQTAAGSTTTGNSGMQLDATVGTDATFPLRIVDFWDADEIGSLFPHMLVKINEGDHKHRTALGV